MNTKNKGITWEDLVWMAYRFTLRFSRKSHTLKATKMIQYTKTASPDISICDSADNRFWEYLIWQLVVTGGIPFGIFARPLILAIATRQWDDYFLMKRIAVPSQSWGMLHCNSPFKAFKEYSVAACMRRKSPLHKQKADNYICWLGIAMHIHVSKSLTTPPPPSTKNPSFLFGMFLA